MVEKKFVAEENVVKVEEKVEKIDINVRFFFKSLIYINNITMPTMNNYLNLIYVNLGFIAQIAIMMYFRSILEIKKNWPVYRCNPPFWIFSENISEDFTYCVQNTQMNMMGYLLQPLNYMVSSLTSIGGQFNESINSIRMMFSSIRGFVSDIIQNVFGVFLNLIVEFQKIIISITFVSV